MISDRSGPDNPFGYASYLHRPETGHYLARNRHYDPVSGRWTSRDPIGYADGFNLYEYVASGPARHTDPSGLQINDRSATDILQDNCNTITAQETERVKNGERSPAEAACRIRMICQNLVTQNDIDNTFWRGFKRGYTGASLGVVSVFTGGLFDHDYGYLGFEDEVLAYFGYTETDLSYRSGLTTGRVAETILLVTGGAEITGLGKYNLRLAVHGPHAGGPHRFWHFQANWWIKGMKGSGGVWRFGLRHLIPWD